MLRKTSFFGIKNILKRFYSEFEKKPLVKDLILNTNGNTLSIIKMEYFAKYMDYAKF